MKPTFKEALMQEKYDAGVFFQEVECSEEECQKYAAMMRNKENLPENIVCFNTDDDCDEFIKLIPLDISHEDLQDYCALRQTRDIRTIKKCVIFFTVLAIIGLLGALIYGIYLGDAISSLL